MNILFVSNDPLIFDARSAVRARMEHYAQEIGTLHIVSPGLAFAAPYHSEHLHLYPVRVGRLRRTRALAREALRVLRANQIALISAQDPFEQGAAALRAAQRSQVPLHVQVHTDFLSPWFVRGSLKAQLLNRFRRRIATRVLPKAACIRVVSERIKTSLESAYAGKIVAPVVLPISVSAAQEEPAAFPGYTEGERVIFAASRLEPEKRLTDVVRAFAQVHHAHAETVLCIAGEGRERARLEALASRLKVREAVRFLGARSDVRALMAAAEVFVQASAYEGYGLTLIEAALAGAATVATPVGVVGDVLEPERDLLTAPIAQPHELATQIIRLLEDDALRAQLGASAQTHAAEHVAQYADGAARIAENLAQCAALTQTDV